MYLVIHEHTLWINECLFCKCWLCACGMNVESSNGQTSIALSVPNNIEHSLVCETVCEATNCPYNTVLEDMGDVERW